MTTDTLASRLTQRITIESPVETPDGNGGFTTTWEEFATVWAEVKPMTAGGESFADGQLQMRQSSRFILRNLAGLVANMRIVHDGRSFNIRALRYPEATKHYLEIIAEEGVAL